MAKAVTEQLLMVVLVLELFMLFINKLTARFYGIKVRLFFEYTSVI